MKLKFLCFSILFLLSSLRAYNQGLHNVKVQSGIGVSWQSTLFVPFDMSVGSMDPYSVIFFPYNYEKNTQGFGLDPQISIGYQVSPSIIISFNFNPILRYDYAHDYWDNRKSLKEFMVDYHYSLQFKYFSKKGRTHILELGYATHNTGKAYYFENKPLYDSTLLNFQYPSFDFNYWIQPFIKMPIIIGLRISYIPRDHPLYPYDPFMTLGLNINYSFLSDDITFSKLRKKIKKTN